MRILPCRFRLNPCKDYISKTTCYCVQNEAEGVHYKLFQLTATYVSEVINVTSIVKDVVDVHHD